MNDEKKSRKELITELQQLRNEISHIKKKDSGDPQTEITRIRNELEESRILHNKEIFKRKNIEEALTQSAEKYHRLFNLSDDLMCVTDLYTGRLFSVNDAACEHLKYSREEILQHFISDIVLFKSNTFKKDLVKKISENKYVRFETEVLTRKKERIPVEVKSHKLDLDGHMAVLHIARDIKERKRMEEELHRYTENLENIIKERTNRIQELEKQRTEIEKTAATGRMAAQIAHEINNPLAGIKNSFLLIKDVVPADHPYYPYAERIEKEITRIAKIVRQMFDLYRQDQKSTHEFILEESIFDVVYLLEPACNERKVTVSIKSNKPKVKVLLPEGSVRQVMFNVVKNAIEASPREGKVAIDIKAADSRITIFVKDNGPGISKRDESKIFEPFYSGKKSGKLKGMGLGLSISKGIVDALNGTLDFESTSGETTFKIEFPARFKYSLKEEVVDA
jgi:PAS domain S-box-containing protein